MTLPGSQHHQGKPGGWGMGKAPGLGPNLNLWSQSKGNAPPYPMDH
ncbi:rCG37166 [Rattus norvegicus]|uniref:RCG37166 n=1 Tax=Rattus norvegicus TaxID=10116 RepID=A6HTX7_RAT|nr:rCG37166 [Rattus norvegicus]